MSTPSPRGVPGRAPIRQSIDQVLDRDPTAGRPERVDAVARTRQRKGNQVIDPFYIPPRLIPDGMSWEWKRHTTYGQQDVSYENSLMENGWEPVDASRPEVKGFMPAGYKGPVIRNGLMLMERPIELTQEARDEDTMLARSQVRAKEQQLRDAPDGTFERTKVVAKTTIERMEIPEE